MESWKLVLSTGLIALGGVAVGATVFGSEPAEAQTRYRECIFARQETVDTDDEGRVAPPSRRRTVQIPHGWTPIVGGGFDRGGILLLCR